MTFKVMPVICMIVCPWSQTMTTNHRPTLESKRGKTISVTDSIVHARQIGQNQSLKLRSDVNPQVAKRAWMELKEEQAQVKKSKLQPSGKESTAAQSSIRNDSPTTSESNETQHDDIGSPGEKQESNNESEDEESDDESDSDEELRLFEQLQRLRNSMMAENPIDKQEVSNSKSQAELKTEPSSESDSESDSSEDEEAQLLAELNAIKKEREAVKAKENIRNSNPLMETSTAFGAKKNWRSATSFRKKSVESTQFTNDSLKSKSHKDFLSKYVR